MPNIVNTNKPNFKLLGNWGFNSPHISQSYGALRYFLESNGVITAADKAMLLNMSPDMARDIRVMRQLILTQQPDRTNNPVGEHADSDSYTFNWLHASYAIAEYPTAFEVNLFNNEDFKREHLQEVELTLQNAIDAACVTALEAAKTQITIPSVYPTTWNAGTQTFDFANTWYADGKFAAYLKSLLKEVNRTNSPVIVIANSGVDKGLIATMMYGEYNEYNVQQFGREFILLESSNIPMAAGTYAQGYICMPNAVDLLFAYDDAALIGVNLPDQKTMPDIIGGIPVTYDQKLQTWQNINGDFPGRTRLRAEPKITHQFSTNYCPVTSWLQDPVTQNAPVVKFRIMQ